MCGLTFFTGKGSPKKASIVVLGMFNESRGGDGVGLSMEGNIIHSDNHQEKKFPEFLEKRMMDMNFEGVHTLLLHTRKSTSGHGLENTHPFGFRKGQKEVVCNDNSKPYDMIGMHNGTITNYQALAELYDLGQYANMDSKVILGALYETKNYEVLSKYNGAAALVWYKGDDLYVFKGADYSGTIEERSLFCVEEEEGIYFSSLENSLLAISSNPVTPVLTNTVLHYNKGKLISSTPIEKPKPPVPLIKTYTKACIAEFSKTSNRGYKQDEVYMFNGRYHVNGMKITDSVRINLETSFLSNIYNISTVEEFHFVDGIMLKDKISAAKWKVKLENVILAKGTNKIDFTLMSQDFACPFYFTENAEQNSFYEGVPNTLFFKGKRFDDTLIYPITGNSIEAINGVIHFSNSALDDLLDTLFFATESVTEAVEEYSYILHELEPEQLDKLTSLINAYNEINESLFTNI